MFCRGRPMCRPVAGPAQRRARADTSVRPYAIWGGVPEPTGIGAGRDLLHRGGTEPAPYGGPEAFAAGCAWGVASASQISERNLGRRSWASAPTPRGGTRDGTPGRRALRVVAESRRDCPGQRRTAERLRRGREGWVGIGAEIIPKVSSNAGQSLSQPAADSSLCTREP